MLTNRFILSACDAGTSDAITRGVVEGYPYGVLKCVNFVPNGEVFDSAIDTILPQCPDIDCGVQLNITRGKSICSDVLSLTDEECKFKNSFLMTAIKVYNPKDEKILPEIEREFRRQIEKVMAKAKVTHISSTDNIIVIPRIFDLVCKLAKEYGIKYIRSSYEKLYIVPDIFRHLNLLYFMNIAKTLMFNLAALFNDPLLYKYEIKTNDYMLGGIYEGMCDVLAVSYGISALKYNNITVECSIRPCRYNEGIIDNYFDEFLVTKNKKLKNKIEEIGFEITNYAEKEA